MLVKQAIEKLQAMSPDKSIICQVVDAEGHAWNMHFDFLDINSNLVQLEVSHPDLKVLPSIEFGGGKQHPPA